MDYSQAILLGIIQGIAEWLPVSSEGMVTLAGKFLAGLSYSDALGIAIWLHSGTLLAVLAYFHKDFIQIIQSAYKKKAKKDLLIFLLLSTFSSALVAAPLLLLAFSVELPEALFTILIGVFLVGIAFLQKTRSAGRHKQLKPFNAVITGVVQGFAALPGISRSGVTVAALLAQEYSLKDSFKLSFLMSAPIVLGAQLALPLVKEGFTVDGPMLAGGLAAALTGVATIRLLMDFAEKTDFFKATLALGVLVMLAGLAMFL